jgi:hypothetical protein
VTHCAGRRNEDGSEKARLCFSFEETPGRTAMELATTPMTERQRKYRENYREQRL